MGDTGGNGEVTRVTVAKVLKKRLTVEPQSDQYMRDLIPDHSHNIFQMIVVTSEKGIGEVGTKLPQE